VTLLFSVQRDRLATGCYLANCRLRVIAFMMLVLRTLQLLCLDDPKESGDILVTKPGVTPGPFHRGVYGVISLFFYARDVKGRRWRSVKQERKAERRRERQEQDWPSRLPLLRRFARAFPFPRLEQHQRDIQVENQDIERQLANRFVPLPRLPPPCHIPPEEEPPHELADFAWMFRTAAAPPPRPPTPTPPTPPPPRLPPKILEDILCHYTILSSVVSELHCVDFLHLALTSKSVNTSLHNAAGPSLRTAASHACAIAQPLEPCLLCKLPICGDCAQYTNIPELPHRDCIRICTWCILRRKCEVRPPQVTGSRKDPCQCHNGRKGWICWNVAQCAERQEILWKELQTKADGKRCATCGGRFWRWIRPFQWWVHAVDNCGRDCNCEVHPVV
jgi:hypothetical protein